MRQPPTHAPETESAQKDVADEQLMRAIDESGTVERNRMQQKVRITIVVCYGILILLGVGTGYILSRNTPLGASTQKPTMVKTDTVAGITDTKTFKDSAIGVIEKDGIDGEGTHKLIRDGGPSQTVYLISSVVDLDEFAGKKVKVWGETFAAKKAAWLMDVGKVEILQK